MSRAVDSEEGEERWVDEECMGGERDTRTEDSVLECVEWRERMDLSAIHMPGEERVG